MSDAEKIVAALSMDNVVDAKEAFESALAAKINDKFEAKKIELAAEMNESTKTDIEETVKFDGKTFTNYKTFNSDSEANKFLEKNDDYGVIGVKGGKVYVSKMDDMGESLDEAKYEPRIWMFKTKAEAEKKAKEVKKSVPPELVKHVKVAPLANDTRFAVIFDGTVNESLDEAKMDNSEVLSAAKRLAKNGKDEKTKKFGQGLVDFYEKNKSFTPDQVSGLQNIMKNASFQMAKDD